MLSAAQLKRLGQVHITDIEKSALADIQDICADTDLPASRRLEIYLRRVKNPYLFRCGDTAIKLEFSSEENTIDDALYAYLSHLKNP